MLRVASPSVVPRMESLFDGGSVAGLSDRQLIERFAARRDSTGEAAFAALVARHGPMFWASAGSFWVTVIMPKTPSRLSFWCWLSRLGRSATPNCWATGCMGLHSE